MKLTLTDDSLSVFIFIEHQIFYYIDEMKLFALNCNSNSRKILSKCTVGIITWQTICLSRQDSVFCFCSEVKERLHVPVVTTHMDVPCNGGWHEQIGLNNLKCTVMKVYNIITCIPNNTGIAQITCHLLQCTESKADAGLRKCEGTTFRKNTLSTVHVGIINGVKPPCDP